MVAPEQRDADPVEAEVRGERDRHLAVDAEHLDATTKGGQGPADGQSQDRVQADAHPGVVRRPRREPYGPELEPPLRAPQEQVDRDRGQERQKETVVRPAEAKAEGGNAGSGVYRGRTGDESSAAQRMEGQVGGQVYGDEVQHDRRDHLVRPEVRLEEARYGAPQKTSQNAGKQDQERSQGTEEPQSDPEPRSRYGPDKDLSLATDVEQPRAEGYGHGEAGEDQGRRVQHRPADGERRPDRAHHQGLEGRRWVVAGREHDDGPDNEGKQDG